MICFRILMKKSLNIIFFALLSLPLVYFLAAGIIDIASRRRESNLYHVWIYNFTDEDITLIINNGYSINVDANTFYLNYVSRNRVFGNTDIYNREERRYNYFNYLIKSGSDIIFNNDMNVFGAYSAYGGIMTNIVIRKTDDYDILFTLNEAEDWFELNFVSRY